MRFHACAMSVWDSCGQPSSATILFPGLTTGNDRPALEPEALGSHGLPHIDIRVAQDLDVWRKAAQRLRLLNQPGLFGTGDEVVDENPQAPTRAGRKSRTTAARSSTPSSISTTTPSILQVVAPDLLDELGVVLALDEDA